MYSCKIPNAFPHQIKVNGIRCMTMILTTNEPAPFLLAINGTIQKIAT